MNATNEETNVMCILALLQQHILLLKCILIICWISASSKLNIDTKNQYKNAHVSLPLTHNNNMVCWLQNINIMTFTP